MRSRVVLPIALALGLGFVSACGESEGTGPGSTGAITIEISKTSLSIVQGGSDVLTATITRSGGFTGSVTITTEGAPAGVTASVSNVTTSGSTTTGTITVAVAASVAPGSFSLTVKASGTGVSEVTKALSLTVTAIPAIGLSLTGSPLSVVQGASGSVTVNLTRTNFTGAVNLTIEGAPQGVTGTFNPASVSGTTSTLTIQVGASVAVGSYNLTVRAAGEGVTAQTAPLVLTVTLAAQAIGVSLSPPSLSLGQGASGDVTVTLTRTNFTGNINLTLEGAPQGVTGTFNPAAATGTSSTLTVQVGASVAAGNYSLTVRAAGQGVTDQTAPLALVVTAGSTGNYTLTTTPSGTVSLQQGATTSPTVNINRTGGFTGSVSLTVTGAPAGLTATLSPTSTTGNSSTLSLTASASLATGNYQLTVTGTATGLADQTVSLTVTITGGSGGSGNVSLDYGSCPASSQPIWMAYQDGTGPWTRVTPVNNVFTFNITQSKGGFAAVFPLSATVNTLSIQYFSQAELVGFTGVTRCPAPSGKTVTGSVANVAALQTALISLGGAGASASAAAPNFTLTNVASGTHDLVAYAGALTGPSGSDRGVIQRDLNPSPGGSVGAIDFTGGASFAPASGTITLTNPAGGETINQSMSYRTGSACDPATLYPVGLVSGNTFTAYGIPAAQQRATDLHSLMVTAINGTTSFRAAIEFFGALGNRNLALPAALPVPALTSLTGPYKRLRFQFTLPAEYSQSVTLLYADAGGSGSAVTMIATVAGYLGGQAVDLSVPDLSGVSGWSNAWAPASSATVLWNATGAGSNLTTACTANGRIVTGTQMGQI
jgi:uncharacterized membrane protein